MKMLVLFKNGSFGISQIKNAIDFAYFIKKYLKKKNYNVLKMLIEDY